MKGKRLIACLVFVCFCLHSGCGKAQTKIADTEEGIKAARRKYQIEAASVVKTEDCYICGDREESLMPYYAKRDSVGIIHWNQLEIIDSDVRAYDDDGNELFGQKGSSMSVCSFGDGYGSVTVSGTPNRGFTHVKAYCKEQDELDFAKVRKMVCQKCIDKASAFYEDQINYEEGNRIATTGYCLVDFSTKELYTLSDPYRGYFIRDYYVSYDIVEESEGTGACIEIFILYAPEREE